MEYLSNDHEDHCNQHENSHKPRNEMGYPNGGKAIVEQILASEEINKFKRAGL